MVDFVALAELLEFDRCELQSVVGHQFFGQSMSNEDVAKCWVPVRVDLCKKLLLSGYIYKKPFKFIYLVGRNLKFSIFGN